jgi:hypothetical protein
VLISITVTSPSSNPIIIIKDSTLQFTAQGTFSDGSHRAVTASWTSTANAVAIIDASSGLATTKAAGHASIEATSSGITGATTLMVTAPASGLVGYWTFDEGTGTVAFDYSGNGLDLSLPASGITWVSGHFAGAIAGDGSSGATTDVALDLSGTAAVTVSLWVSHSYNFLGSSVLYEFSEDYNGNTDGFVFIPDSSDANCLGLEVGLRGDSGYSAVCFDQPPPSSPLTWHHFVAVLDKSQGQGSEVALWMDGAPANTINSVQSADNTNHFGNRLLHLLSRKGTMDFCPAAIDELKIFNRAVSTAEIQDL